MLNGNPSHSPILASSTRLRQTRFIVKMKELSSIGLINFANSIAMLALSTTAVVLRFLLRPTKSKMLTPSEWFCILSLLFFYAYGAIQIQGKLTPTRLNMSGHKY